MDKATDIKLSNNPLQEVNGAVDRSGVFHTLGKRLEAVNTKGSNLTRSPLHEQYPDPPGHSPGEPCQPEKNHKDIMDTGPSTKIQNTGTETLHSLSMCPAWKEVVKQACMDKSFIEKEGRFSQKTFKNSRVKKMVSSKVKTAFTI